jgi:hypothetical protein
MMFSFLARAYDAPFDPPQTVGDVLELRGGIYHSKCLHELPQGSQTMAEEPAASGETDHEAREQRERGA